MKKEITICDLCGEEFGISRMYVEIFIKDIFKYPYTRKLDVCPECMANVKKYCIENKKDKKSKFKGIYKPIYRGTNVPMQASIPPMPPKSKSAEK